MNCKTSSRLGLSLTFVAMFTALFIAGCGSGEPATYEVRGTVEWKGEPVTDGYVNFFPDGGQPVKADAGKIANGAFVFRSTAGPKTVEIWANREKPGQTSKVMGMREKEQYIPAKYNSQSTLKAEVTPAGPNQFTFKLD
jgi:hypothetical protein